MQVKLVSHSIPTEEFRVQGVEDTQDLVAFCARVSNPGNQNNKKTADKLVQYLIRNKHWSPLEMASACLEITTTRDIARQILRHRSFSFQEFSQRYADPDKELAGAFVQREARLQDPKNRQNSIEITSDSAAMNPEQIEMTTEWQRRQVAVQNAAKSAYEWAMEQGIAKEQARSVLPEGMTVSRMYMNGTLRSWTHFIELRSGNGTQKECQEVAIASAKALEPVFPMIMDFVAKK
jgi:thymidylate synthase (FAD)